MEILKEIGNLVTQCGVLSGFELFIIVYLAKLVADERSARERDRITSKEEASERVEAFEEIAKTLSVLSMAIAEIKGTLLWSRRP